MFRKLRIKFIATATLAITLILTFFLVLMNSIVYTQTEDNIHTVLSILTKNEGELPITDEIKESLTEKNIQEGIVYNFQYFSVREKENDYAISLTNVQSLTEAEVKSFLPSILKRQETYGSITHKGRYFTYQVSQSTTGKLLVFFETTNYIRERDTLLQVSIWLALASLLLLILLFTLISGIVIRPFIKNYEKQRMFITNAGHELKTPLAIISANTELQELIEGETEWSSSTKEQTERLNHLIGRLIRLARLEEQEDIKLAPQNISVIAEKVASDFAPLFTKEDKKFESSIEADVVEKVAQEEFYELLSILLDNARKYCDPAGTIRLTLQRKNYLLRKRTCITISNDYKDGQAVNIKRFFDRFYRAETSHNNQTISGHGIGLSMAQHLVSLFRGKIFVTYKKQVITFTIWL
ncbi:HAMP domain-containing histidine kinase [Streptococcus oralis]|uniref:sensor histidine kinase n=1 Tax=Streptococcus oralis TaxID=1303 RepID=UPI0020258B8D|nr:HAMP domain-containing sensor histidine kinase [Streptococcus oralis]URK67463.1 HAMP domain-containing histidine kinase [Streptococcus oralis]